MLPFLADRASFLAGGGDMVVKASHTLAKVGDLDFKVQFGPVRTASIGGLQHGDGTFLIAEVPRDTACSFKSGSCGFTFFTSSSFWLASSWESRFSLEVLEVDIELRLVVSQLDLGSSCIFASFDS